MVDQIVHLADLHIRSGNNALSRYEEYSTVFERIVVDVSTLAADKSTIIIIAGDVFHHKLRIESPGIKLILRFLKALAKIAPVYVIRGNHDYKQENPSEPDLIESILAVGLENVTYLSETGSYKLAENLGVGLVAIQDALMAGNTCGITNELPPFPAPPQDVDVTLALFHGPVSRTRLQNGTIMEGANTYPLEWFGKGYDAIMLGDIHVQQVNKGTKIIGYSVDHTTGLKHSTLIDKYSWAEGTCPWAYAGSTIQQDFGEGIKGHGFMLWDLKEKTIECYHVKNDYGFVTIRTPQGAQGRLIFKISGLNMDIDTALAQPWFPRNVQVRFFGREGAHEALQRIFAKHDIVITRFIACAATDDETSLMSDGYSNNNSKLEITDISQFNTPQTWIEYIRGSLNQGKGDDNSEWENWFRNHESLLMPECDNRLINQRIQDKNARITKRLGEYQSVKDINTQQSSTKKPFLIHRLEWDYILCFGKGNHFSFDDLSSKISAISAKNGCGKTSFLETVCIALYGEGFPSRFNKTFSAALICQNRPKGSAPHTCITFSIDGAKYKLKRKFSTHSGDANKLHSVPKDIAVDAVDENGEYRNIHSGKTAVDAWVQRNVGSLQAFLLSCMVTQNSDMDFFDLKGQEQKDLLDNALAINDSTEFHAVLKEARLAYAAVLDAVSTTLDVVSDDKNTNVDALKEERCSLEAEIAALKERENKAFVVDNDIIALLKMPKAVLEEQCGTFRERLASTSIRPDPAVDYKEAIAVKKAEIMAHNNRKTAECRLPMCELSKRVEDCEWSDDICHIDKCMSTLQNWYEVLVRSENFAAKHCNPSDRPFNPDCWACTKLLTEHKEKMAIALRKASKLCEQNIENSEMLAHHIRVIEGHKKNVLALQWLEEREQLKGDLDKLIDQYDILTVQANENLYERCLAVYDDYQQVAAIREELTKLAIRLSHVTKDIETATANARMRESLGAFRDVLRKKHDTIQGVYDIFGGFKSWIYKEKVLPALVRCANGIMSSMCEDRPLALESEIAPTTIHWFLRDGSNAPPIEKASGFQRFIAGLAMRIALGRFGASGINARQIFIDEGFTACDTDNIGKVGTFLERLPAKHVIIVTHLEEIKSCAGQFVYIERAQGAKTSRLHFGGSPLP